MRVARSALIIDASWQRLLPRHDPHGRLNIGIYIYIYIVIRRIRGNENDLILFFFFFSEAGRAPPAGLRAEFLAFAEISTFYS